MLNIFTESVRCHISFSLSLFFVCFACLSFSIAVFRAGEQGRFWYAVLGGSLEVRYHAPDTENKVWMNERTKTYFSSFQQQHWSLWVTHTHIKSYFWAWNKRRIDRHTVFIKHCGVGDKLKTKEKQNEWDNLSAYIVLISLHIDRPH